MDKLQMAHDMALELVKIKPSLSAWQIADRCFEYADAMQAEADKRKPSGLPEVLREEWQPDWSLAPDWANWWAMDGFSKKANWYIDKPYLDDDSEVESEWNIDLKINSETYLGAPSFNYQGNWQDSLRKRPQ